MTRDNILLRKRAVSKMVALPNGRIFYAKYERTRCTYLPPNVRVTKKEQLVCADDEDKQAQE